MVMTVEIPLRIGDIAWGIKNYKGEKIVKSAEVKEIFFTRNMELAVRVHRLRSGILGKDVFLAEEDAKRALKQMGEKNAIKRD